MQERHSQSQRSRRSAVVARGPESRVDTGETSAPQEIVGSMSMLLIFVGDADGLASTLQAAGLLRPKWGFDP